MLSQADVRELTHDQLYPLFRQERERIGWLDKWLGHEHEPLRLPVTATREQRDLRDLARTPWLGQAVRTTVQGLVVNGYRSPDQRGNSTAWEIWERNDFDAKQVAIHHAAIGYGYCYGKAMPGVINGERRARLTAVDPSRAVAVYSDPVDDEWPLYVLQGEPRGESWLMTLTDETHEHIVSLSADGDKIEYVEWREHNVGVTPFVRYAPRMDLRGRALGEVEPNITLAKRMNRNVHDRLEVQRYNSWKIRYASGVDLAKDLPEPGADATIDDWVAYRAEIERRRIKLQQSDMLTAQDPDTKFGTLDETPLEGFIKVDESDKETFCAVTQTPPTTLGKVSNLSADAIAEIRSGLEQKQKQDQKGLGKSHAQLLRLGAHIEGDEAAASDFRSRITWADTGIRSLAQAADALGKLSQMLGVPAQSLWSMIPGVEQADVDEWIAVASQGDALTNLTSLLEQQATPSAPTD